MRNIIPVGVYKDTVLVAPPWDSSPFLKYGDCVHMGVRVDVFQRLREFSLATAIAQYYGIVQTDMIFTDVIHLFSGLRRELMNEENMRADEDVLVYSWAPRFDYVWDHASQMPIVKTPPRDRVFVVQARQFERPDENGIIGEILHWNWVKEDRSLRGAPIDHHARYAGKLWTKIRFRK